MPPADAPPAHLRDALVGQRLVGSAGVSYFLTERVGEGGQGWVFKANWAEPSGIVVIVKVLRPDIVLGEALPRFQREAEVLRRLSQQPRPNPYIVRFFDHAIAQFPMPGTSLRVGLPFTVLEYVHGPTLEQVLSASGGRGLGVERVLRLGRHVVHALELVHSQKIVHRDLKPSNILLASEHGGEVAKVTDFGLVKLVDASLQRTTTLAGASLGYAPPEQYEQGNQRVSPRTDIFSLAAILFEMITGAPAFPFKPNENPLLIVTRIINGPRPSIARYRPHLSPELRDRPELAERLHAVLTRAFAAEPDARQGSVTELWAELEPILRVAGGYQESVPPPSRLPFADTDLARTRPSVGGGPPGSTRPSNVLEPSHVRVAAPPMPEPHTPADGANEPASWTWRVVTRPLKPGLVRAGAFSADGGLAVAAGPSGLARWERGAWAGLALPPSLDASAIRGVRILEGGDLLVLGERSLAARIGHRGALQIWSVPERDLSLSAAFAEPSDVFTLVGEAKVRRSASAPGDAIGCVVRIRDGKVEMLANVPGTGRLHDVTRLANGSFACCGDWGAIVRVDVDGVEHVGSVCRGHLQAIAGTADGGALTVGAGGHALYLSPRLEPSLEAVQTTRDLQCLTLSPDGSAWAGAVQARLLRRTGNSWVRMSGELGMASAVQAVWADTRRVRALCDDGAIIEGTLG